MTVPQAVEHCVGLQAQLPDHPHLGLFARREALRASGGPEPDRSVDTLIAGRQLVRMVVMRSTIHLIGAADAATLRPVVQPALTRELKNWRADLDGLDLAAVAAAGRALCAERPRTWQQLGEELAPVFGRAGHPLAMAVRSGVPLVQIPPRGLWRVTGPVAHVPAADWTGLPDGTDPDPIALVRRYLAAFGPATAADVTTFTGVSGTARVLAAMPDLTPFTDDRGRQLWDVPDGLRPDPDHPAPVRLLPGYDNTVLAHADRTRVIADADRAAFGRDAPGAVLIDGFVAGLWRFRTARGTETVAVEALHPWTGTERAAVEREASAVLAFSTPGSVHVVEID
nr:winged helix DNA-binding domain-containing protein [Nakamurella flavida]